jgi:hypothetical protein
MSDRIAQRRRRREQTVFGAPWGRVIKLATGAAVLVMATVIVVPLLALSSKPAPLWVRWSAPALVLGIFGVTGLFAVRGFELHGRELRVQRAFWQTRIPLHDLREAYADPTAMRGSLRTFGNGGFLALTGWFRNKRLGNYRAFVTDPGRCVVLRFKQRTFVVSPDDPAAFVSALGFGKRDHASAAE